MAVAVHTPALAARSTGDDPRRSLLLAGGGMRVAYQAGVLVALEEAGLAFEHADGTSGGTINLAMLLSGLAPAQMCERWRTLRLRDFVSPLPLRSYLRGPSLPGLGDADGLRDRVYPHLGIDVERIRAATGIGATFNVCDFTDKVNRAVEHADIDLDLLVAGVSLPILTPAVHHGGRTYVDSVWIKDANLIEAVRRGAEELWLVWCIGNSGPYRDGAFDQYVHMIEMSANGVLFEELDRIRELNAAIAAGHSPYGQRGPIRLHVIRPGRPLPLDPDFFFGRIDAGTLVAMGYRDATRYLEGMTVDGVAFGPEATRMCDPRPGVAFRQTLRGELMGGPLTVRVAAEVDDLDAFEAGAPRLATAVGDVSHPALGERVLVRRGSFSLDGSRMDHELTFGRAGAERCLELEQQLTGAGVARLAGLRRARATLYDGPDRRAPVLARGELRGSLAGAAASLHARGVASPRDGGRAVRRFLRSAARGS